MTARLVVVISALTLLAGCSKPADVTILNPDRYRDRATFEQPRLNTEGVIHVLVNGTFAVRDGEVTGALAGVPLTRP